MFYGKALLNRRGRQTLTSAWARCWRENPARREAVGHYRAAAEGGPTMQISVSIFIGAGGDGRLPARARRARRLRASGPRTRRLTSSPARCCWRSRAPATRGNAYEQALAIQPTNVDALLGWGSRSRSCSGRTRISRRTGWR